MKLDLKKKNIEVTRAEYDRAVQIKEDVRTLQNAFLPMGASGVLQYDFECWKEKYINDMEEEFKRIHGNETVVSKENNNI